MLEVTSAHLTGIEAIPKAVRKWHMWEGREASRPASGLACLLELSVRRQKTNAAANRQGFDIVYVPAE